MVLHLRWSVLDMATRSKGRARVCWSQLVTLRNCSREASYCTIRSSNEQIWNIVPAEVPEKPANEVSSAGAICSGGCTLATIKRQWEVRFIVSLNHGPDYLDYQYPVRLYGETVNQLQQKVRAYLKKHRPSYFNNFGDHITGEKSYVCSNGQIRPPFQWKMDPALFDELRGWWHNSERYVSGRPQRDDTTPHPFHIGDL